MKEYEFLRAEMMDYYQTISQYNVVMYTATATILVFALKESLFLFCLIPYCVVLPLYLMCEAKRRGICRIAAYMIVFLEGKDYNWESRHHSFDEKNEIKKRKRFFRTSSSPLPFFLLAMVCSLASLCKVYFYDTVLVDKLIQAAIVVLITVVAIVVMTVNKVDYTKVRQQYIDKWREWKKDENSEDKDRQPIDNIINNAQ
jgi:hypothetical protein